jgi:hypothetical protein
VDHLNLGRDHKLVMMKQTNAPTKTKEVGGKTNHEHTNVMFNFINPNN